MVAGEGPLGVHLSLAPGQFPSRKVRVEAQGLNWHGSRFQGLGTRWERRSIPDLPLGDPKPPAAQEEKWAEFMHSLSEPERNPRPPTGEMNTRRGWTQIPEKHRAVSDTLGGGEPVVGHTQSVRVVVHRAQIPSSSLCVRELSPSVNEYFHGASKHPPRTWDLGASPATPRTADS